MVVEVLGYQKLDFKDRDTGEPVSGYNIYFAEPITQRGEGNAYIKQFIRSDRVVGDVGLGQAQIDMQISLRGKAYLNSFKMVSLDAKSGK